MYLADDLITSVKRRGAVPTAQSSFQTQDFLSVADEETQGFVLPLIRRTREDFGLQSQDFTITAPDNKGSTGPYRIPYRAVGGALRDVYTLDSSGNVLQVPRISLDDLELASFGIYLVGNQLYFLNRRPYTVPVTLRMTYFMRPSRLVLAANAAQVASFNAVAQTVTLASVPAGYTGQTAWDIVRGRPGFEHLAFDFAGTLAGSVVTFSAALPPDLAVGDYVCLPEQTPIPQIPAELHPLLAQRVVVKVLEAQSDAQGMAEAAQILSRMEQDAMVLLSPRIEGEPKKIVPRGGPFRRGRRW